MAGECKASSLECSASITATVCGTDGADGAHGVGGVGGAVRSSCHLRLLPARLSSRRRSRRRMRRVLTKTRRTSNPIHTNTGVDTRDGPEGGDGEWPSSVAFMRVADPRPSPPVPPERVRHFVSSSVCPDYELYSYRTWTYRRAVPYWHIGRPPCQTPTNAWPLSEHM